MFHIDNGIKLTRAGLALDFRRRQPRGYISHAHFDHLARHELALCTPPTARLYQHRLGRRTGRETVPRRQVLELPFGKPVEFGGLSLTTFPAGHCLGSSMLLAEERGRRLLYTGDFRLGSSATVVPCDLPRADVLIMESTFGRPQYRFPPREESIASLVSLVRQILESRAVPVLHLYPLGKSQEVTKILTERGIGVFQHPETYAISRLYEACGVDLGQYGLYRNTPPRGSAVITLPKSSPRFRLPGLERAVSIAATGWAACGGTARRLGVDHAIPLSDHADYDELHEAVRRVAPAKIYCTHGPADFVDDLRSSGWDAARVEWSTKRAMA